MLRSLYSGVSGLQNHQTRMDVVGNNVANVNTIGFKKGRVNFQDLISQGIKGSSRPNEAKGGVNPQQVGLGVSVASVDTIHTQGSFQSTGIKTDLAIQGNGFFILKNGEKQLYTRAGAFSIDQEGILVNPANGMRVQGWQSEMDENGNNVIDNSAPIGKISIPVGDKDQARATNRVFLASNLNKTTPLIADPNNPEQVREGSWVTTYDVLDSYGNTHQIRLSYQKSTDGGDPPQEIPNQWVATAEIIDGITTESIGEADDDDRAIQLAVAGTANGDGDNQVVVTFDNEGSLLSVGNGAGGESNAGELNFQVTFPVPNGGNDADGNPLTQTIDVVLGEVGSYSKSTTQFASESTNKFYEADGNKMGYLEDFTIDNQGIITGVYSNGTTKELAQLGMASFTNPGGLEKAGNTAFVKTSNSGNADIGVAGTTGKGIFQAGILEMSNVDLAEQFTDMIVTQRGFQANSKTITTSDQLLQELLQLKR